MGIVFCKNSFIGELFWHFRIYGYDFQKILQIYGYTFEEFLRIYGWYFYDLNGTTPYLENSSYPPPLGGKSNAGHNIATSFQVLLSSGQTSCYSCVISF